MINIYKSIFGRRPYSTSDKNPQHRQADHILTRGMLIVDKRVRHLQRCVHILDLPLDLDICITFVVRGLVTDKQKEGEV